jgi:hypothetical protein
MAAHIVSCLPDFKSVILSYACEHSKPIYDPILMCLNHFMSQYSCNVVYVSSWYKEGVVTHIKLSFTPVEHGSGSSPRSLRETSSDLVHFLVLVVGPSSSKDSLIHQHHVPFRRMGSRPDVTLSPLQSANRCRDLHRGHQVHRYKASSTDGETIKCSLLHQSDSD